MGTTLLQLEQNIAKAGYGYVAVTPSAGGTTTTVVANGAGSELDPDDANSLYYSSWLKCVSDSAGTPLNVGEIRRLDSTTGYVASTGTLTVTRAFSNATTTTQRFGIFLGLPAEDYGIARGLKSYINDVLRKLFYRRLFLITLVTDGDMETSGVTNWTTSNASLTKSTTTGVVLGKQSLRVANSGADGYGQSASVSVEASEAYTVAADASVVSGTANLQLWDVTNSASIDTVTSDEKQTRRIWLTANVPSGCKQIAVRLKGSEASADVYWDNLSLLRTSATEHALPSWFKDRKWLEKLAFWSAGSTDEPLDDLSRLPPIEFRVIEDRQGYTPFRVKISRYPVAGAPLIGQALSPYDELSADTDSTEADADWVKNWVLYDLYSIDKKDKEKAAIWLARARDRDKLFAPKWDGKRFKVGMLT